VDGGVEGGEVLVPGGGEGDEGEGVELVVGEDEELARAELEGALCKGAAEGDGVEAVDGELLGFFGDVVVGHFLCDVGLLSVAVDGAGGIGARGGVNDEDGGVIAGGVGIGGSGAGDEEWVVGIVGLVFPGFGEVQGNAFLGEGGGFEEIVSGERGGGENKDGGEEKMSSVESHGKSYRQ